ncbi:MAG: PRD domain-containing protein [Lachnospiraceae bacterium]|nr:PRD domain-containing protein [Lachnospiraceae bacterium]
MIIAKVVNNNIVTSFDSNNCELVIMGRGIGFAKKRGEVIPDEKIEKIFRLENEERNSKLIEIIKDIPLEHIHAADQIITYAKSVLGDKLKETIYLSLIDHINCAIERLKNNISFSNPLLWETKQYYPDEFRAGVQSLLILKKELGLKFPVDEAGFIALHFITSEYDTSMKVSLDIPKFVNNVVSVVDEYFPNRVDKQSIHFERFVTHIKFFAARVLQVKQIPEDDDFLFRTMIREQYSDDYQCALGIKKAIQAEYDIQISEEELVYLTVHIHRITM